MDPLTVAGRYFDAWNRRDPQAISDAFAQGGTYTDPVVPGGLDPPGAARYAEGLFDGFPDLAFAIGREVAGDDGVVCAEWTMTGTNSGPYQGLPPTGRSVRLAGADVIRVEGDRIRSVTGYFDTGVLPAQLGLQVIVQPASVGPFSFGTSVYASKAGTRPGAVSLTVLETRSPAEVDAVREGTRNVVAELLETPGFISWLGVTVGDRMYTITAWDDLDDPAALRRSPAHTDAMARFFGPELARGGQTGVWAPHRLNGMWVRCDACGEMVPGEGTARCKCGAALPEPPSYW